MAEKSSLLAYMDRELGKHTPESDITKTGSDLEQAVVRTYEPLHEVLDGLHKTDIFDMYLDARDVDRDHVRRYRAGLKKFQRAPYRINKSSWLRRLAHSTSTWHDRIYDEQDAKYERSTREGDVSPVPGYFFVDVLGAVSLIGGGIITVAGVLGGSPTAAVTGASILGTAGTYAGFFWKKTKLLPVTTHFKQDAARNYILDLRRFHLLTQEIEREVNDIHRLDDKQKHAFVMKYGKKRMKRENAMTDGLTKDEKERRTFEYGVEEVRANAQNALAEVQRVQRSIETVLSAAGAEPIQLSGGWVPAGKQWYEEEVGPADRVEEELAAAARAPHEAAERLRRTKVAPKVAQ